MILLIIGWGEDIFHVAYPKRLGEDLLQGIFDCFFNNCSGKPLSHDNVDCVYQYVANVLKSPVQSFSEEEWEFFRARLLWYKVHARLDDIEGSVMARRVAWVRRHRT